MRRIVPILRNPYLWLAVLALAARLLPGPRTIDDAAITFRYARNLLAGQGFVYNAGEAVLGTTTPLYTFLMAGLGALTGRTQAPFPELALWANALADALTCLLLVRLAGRLVPEWGGRGLHPAAWAVGVAWAVAPFSVTFAIGGMETSVYVLLLTGMALAALEERHVLAALLGALALLTRPDALILVGPLAAVRALTLLFSPSSRRTWWKEALVFALPVLAWGIFATLTFGSPLPHSLAAKVAAYRLEPLDALIRLIQHYATPFMEQDVLGSAVAVGLGLLLYPLLAVLGARRAWKALAPRSLALRVTALAWMLYPLLYFITFSAANPLIFRWYLTPPLPAYLMLILLGLEAVLQRLASARPSLRAVLGALLFVLALLPVAGEWRLHPDHGPDRPAPEMAFIRLELLYRQAAESLAPGMDVHTLLAAGDVGMLGYYTPARILDTVGLNSPESSRYYPLPAEDYAINYAIPAALVLDLKPQYVVILEVYGRNTLLRDARFTQAYRLVEKLPTDLYGSDGLLIFQAR